MSNLHGKAVAVAADCAVAAALARRLAKAGARVFVGAPPSAALDETVAELKWECASVERLEVETLDGAALCEIASRARAAFGSLEAVVSAAPGLRAAAFDALPPGFGARRLVRVATGAACDETDDAPSGQADARRVTTISSLADARSAADPETIANAVAFALAGPGEVDIRSMVLRPAALAA